MPASDAQQPRVRRRLARALFLFALSPLVYLFVLFCVSPVYVGGQPLMQKVGGVIGDRGGYGFSLERFRDVEQSGPVDVVFVGSSHCYRSFDPRAFSARGLRSFNLGSSSQSPLNSFYVLKRYWPRLLPRLVILEAYPIMMADDGLESFGDLVVNTQPSRELIEMVAAMRNVQAMNLLVSTYFGNLWRPMEAFPQNKYPDQRYIPGGYCEGTGRATAPEATPPVQIEATQLQLDYVKRIVGFAKQRNAATVVVVQPLPRRYLATIGGYRRVSDRIAQAAGEAGAVFWDMNGQVTMDDVEDFRDMDHLNPSGVAKFDEAVLARLAAAGLVPR